MESVTQRAYSSLPSDCLAHKIKRQLEDSVHELSSFARLPLSSRRRGLQNRKICPFQPPQPPAKQPSTPASKGVRFSFVETVRMVPSKAELLTQQEDCGAALWYTKRELHQIKSEARDLVFAVRGCEHFDERCSSSVTIRGLERHVSEEHGLARKENKCAVVGAVLEEQARQRGAGKNCPSSVRMASVNLSWRSRDTARAAAEWDEYMVRCNEEGHRAECRFDHYDVLGGGGAGNADESAPPSGNWHKYQAPPPSNCRFLWQHNDSQRYSPPPQGVKHVVNVDRHCRPLMEVRPKRSIVCR